jgi:hypothetical protein
VPPLQDLDLRRSTVTRTHVARPCYGTDTSRPSCGLFCGLDRDLFRQVHDIVTGKQLTDTEFAATWGDRMAFKGRLRRRLVQTGTGDVA